jgi:hypothetical protein
MGDEEGIGRERRGWLEGYKGGVGGTYEVDMHQRLTVATDNRKGVVLLKIICI